MKKIIVFISTIDCSWLGWWLGAHFSFTVAFFLSIIGTGLGLYAGKQIINIY